MKAILGVLGLVALLGIVYGLARFGVIPTQKLAAKSPAMAKALAALKLAGPAKPKAIAHAAPESPQQQMLDAEKQQLDAQRAQLSKDQAAFEAQQQQALSAQQAPAAPAGPDTGAKLIALYSTMDPDDLAPIFAKLPDNQVISSLMQLDEKKAGEVLAALPPSRAARISELMSAHAPTHTASAAPPVPATSL